MLNDLKTTSIKTDQNVSDLKLTRQFLLDIMSHKYEDDYNDLWYTARKCLKEYLEAEEEKSDE